tara:strand:+ start:207 stop:461 length:255 start_codon:yes stop_codon:yes gene_type:complete
MKKISAYILITLMMSCSAISDEMNSVNKLIQDGYKIINEDIVKRQNSRRFTKVFTLQNKKSSLIICSLLFDSDGYLEEVKCVLP